MFLPIFFSISLWAIIFLLWKWKKSYILCFIYFMVHIQVGSHIIDQQRENDFENAMNSPEKVKNCGIYLGPSEIERGSKNNKYKVTLYHFKMNDGQELDFAHTDLLRSNVPNIQFLENPEQKICLEYTPQFFDLYHFPIMTELTFSK